MRSSILAVAIAAVASPTIAQESGYWIANRHSNDLNRVDEGGVVHQTIGLSTNLRSAHHAPDGKLWVVRFGQSTIDMVDPATGAITPVTHSMGSAFSIAFDAGGHAWVSGGSGVEEFDANGVSQATYPLATAVPLGITIDNQGNKWIAHRTAPASISRIDATTGAITNHAVGAPTNMQPVTIVADYRGFASGMASHIWVIGDSAGDLAEFDDQGNFLNLYPIANSLSGLATDVNGHLWVNDRGGNVWQVDNSGNILNNYSFAVTDSLGIAVDGRSRVWLTDRVTFGTSGPPCRVWRIDPATGTFDVPALVGFGTQSALSTRIDYALVVDPLGDLDGDGAQNAVELEFQGTSPFDAGSNVCDLMASGISQLSATTNTVTLDFSGPSPANSGVLFSFGTSAPLAIPGIDGTFQLGPVIAATPLAAGTYSIAIPVGGDPALDGIELFSQALVLSGLPTPKLTNRASVRVWL